MAETGLPLFDFAAHQDDPLADSKLPPTAPERAVYDLVVQCRGHEAAVSIAALRRATGLNEREIKDAVYELVVTHKVMIGARRGKVCGYFLVETSEDAEIAAKPYEAQIIAMLKRLRVLKSPHKLREFLGQQVAELQ